MTTEEKVIKMKKGIEKLAKKYGLNLTVYDGKIGFVNQEQKKIVALWTPEFKFNENKDDNNEKCHFLNDHYVPIADVVPKSEVEKWKEINEQLHKEMSERILEERKIERKLVAREIFEEIEKLISSECLVIKDENGIRGYVDASVHYALTELKKKYTKEGEDKE